MAFKGWWLARAAARCSEDRLRVGMLACRGLRDLVCMIPIVGLLVQQGGESVSLDLWRMLG